QTGLIADSNGNLLGTTSVGGLYGFGTIFEVQKGTGNIITLVSFDGTDENGSIGGLVQDANGNLFGAAGGGLFGQGTVFELQKNSGTLMTLANFNGSSPYGPLTLDSNGNLFGTTYSGGEFDGGSVFEIQQGSGTITTLASFRIGASRIDPVGPIVVDN